MQYSAARCNYMRYNALHFKMDSHRAAIFYTAAKQILLKEFDSTQRYALLKVKGCSIFNYKGLRAAPFSFELYYQGLCPYQLVILRAVAP